jgi:hypothetical protein
MFAIALAALAAVAAAEVHRWTDAEGRVHYGDRPPAGSQSVPVTTGASPSQPVPSDAERLERQQRMLDAYRQEREEKQQAEARHKAEEAERERNCALARDALGRHLRAAGGRLAPLSERVRARDRDPRRTGRGQAVVRVTAEALTGRRLRPQRAAPASRRPCAADAARRWAW